MNEQNTYNTDDEIQILGTGPTATTSGKRTKIFAAVIIAVIVLTIAGLFVFEKWKNHTVPSTTTNEKQTGQPLQPAAQPSAFIEVAEETINDVPLLIYTPHTAFPKLATSMPDETDSTLVFVAQAADVRADNNEILGDYVVEGKQLARGQRKEGFCAIIDKKITISKGAATPLLQEAIDKTGYFFRQYSLVHKSEPVDNKPKGKAIRRALAIRNGQTLMVESRSRESFHDFAQALADTGFSEAIYLVGESAYGWYYTQSGERITFGAKREKPLPNTNYIVWKAIN